MATMHRTCTLAILFTGLACGEPAQDRGDVGSGGTDGSADDSSGGVTSSPATTVTTSPTTTATTATSDPSDTDAGTTDGGDDPFVFEDGEPTAYTQVDRMGMPAVATLLVGDKDAYNGGTPADDTAEAFVPDIVEHLGALHEALDDDLIAAGLTPCALLDCVQQCSPLIIPDVLRVDFTADSGFPNGRRPSDPVIDIMLAVILLDLTEHAVTTLADLPLNPTEGDRPPPEDFPYFAEPH